MLRLRLRCRFRPARIILRGIWRNARSSSIARDRVDLLSIVSALFPRSVSPASIRSHTYSLTALARLSLIFLLTSTCIFFLLRSFGTQVDEVIKPPYREAVVSVVGSITNYALDWGIDFFCIVCYKFFYENQDRVTASNSERRRLIGQ